MNKKLILMIVLIVCCILFIRYINQKKCYVESARIWNSINGDNYPDIMSSQESFDKNTIQSLASMSYIACLNGDKINIGNRSKEIIDKYS